MNLNNLEKPLILKDGEFIDLENNKDVTIIHVLKA
jgi:hypothetical protein